MMYPILLILLIYIIQLQVNNYFPNKIIKLPTAYTNKNFINLGTVIDSGVDHTTSATLTTTTGTKTTIPFTFTNIPLKVNELRLFWLSFGQ